MHIICIPTLNQISLFTATYGLMITAVVVYFLKDLLVAIIKSVFKHVLNPTIWSRVAVDLNTSPSRATPEPNQRTQSVTESDIRDENVSKALDLAHQQIQFFMAQQRVSNAQPSGIEVLAVRDVSVEKSGSDMTASTCSEPSNGTAPSTGSEVWNSTEPNSTPSDGSGDSYEEFPEDEIIIAQNVSVVSIGSATQPSEISSEYSATDGNESTKSNDRSNNSSISMDTTKSTGDSVEILSISSDTTAS